MNAFGLWRDEDLSPHLNHVAPHAKSKKHCPRASSSQHSPPCSRPPARRRNNPRWRIATSRRGMRRLPGYRRSKTPKKPTPPPKRSSRPSGQDGGDPGRNETRRLSPRRAQCRHLLQGRRGVWHAGWAAPGHLQELGANGEKAGQNGADGNYVEPRSHIIVTTQSLFERWLRAHRTWWDKGVTNVPRARSRRRWNSKGSTPRRSRRTPR